MPNIDYNAICLSDVDAGESMGSGKKEPLEWVTASKGLSAKVAEGGMNAEVRRESMTGPKKGWGYSDK